MTAPLLSVEGLRVAYSRAGVETAAVRRLDLVVEAGEIVGAVGESGSGKSTLALAIMGLLPPRARVGGRMTLGGVALAGLSARARRNLLGSRIAYVPQEPMTAFNPTLRIGRQIDLVLRRHVAEPAAARRARAVSALGAMGVADPARVLASFPFEVSGGQLQRALLAVAFSLSPELILADEPTTALDVTVQAEVLKLLASAARERGAGVLFISHNVAVVSQLCDRVVVMRKGEIVESGPTADVLRAPSVAYTRQLLAALPSLSRPRTMLPVAEAA